MAALFDRELWAEIAPRFKLLRNGERMEKFLARNNLLGLNWYLLENGRSGLSAQSLIKICRSLDVSPTWILFGHGRKRLGLSDAIE